LWLRVECTLFSYLQSRARTHVVLVICWSLPFTDRPLKNRRLLTTTSLRSESK
jgi:hypothetical protein